MKQASPLSERRMLRSDRFWQETAPYLRLVGGSMPGIVLIGLVMLALYGYFVQHVPAHFPVIGVCAVVLTYGVSTVSIRTYMVQADLIYLMPMEARIGEYLRSCLQNGTLMQLLKAVLFSVAVWPLYQTALSETFSGISFPMLLIAMSLLKLLQIYSWWRETYLRYSTTRKLFAFVRMLIAFLGFYVGLSGHLALALLLISLAMIANLLMLQVPERHARASWERWIELERRRRASWRSILKQFVDVPEERTEVSANPAARFASRIALRRENAFDYLYFLIWCRSPLFGMTVRLSAIAVVILLIVDGVWMKAGIYALFAYLSYLQLAEMARKVQDIAAVTVFAFPLSEHKQRRSARKLAQIIGSVHLFLMLIAAFVIPLLR